MADVGSLLVGIAAVGTLGLSAWGIFHKRDEDNGESYWRRRALDCEERDLERDPPPAPSRAHRPRNRRAPR